MIGWIESLTYVKTGPWNSYKHKILAQKQNNKIYQHRISAKWQLNLTNSLGTFYKRKDGGKMILVPSLDMSAHNFRTHE